MLLYQELSYKILGICFAVYNEYGPSHNERIYQNLIEEKLEFNGLNFISQPKIQFILAKLVKKLGSISLTYLLKIK